MAFPNSKRKITLNERLYEVGESLVPPFALQYIVEGTGKLDAESLRICLTQLTEKLPVFTLVLKGDRWAPEGPGPAFFVHETPFSGDWNDPFFQTPIHTEEGHCAQLHLFQGDHSTLVFRVLHRLMDAKGIQLALTCLFALLRGETIHPDTNFSADMEERAQLVEKDTLSTEKYVSQWPAFSLSPKAPFHYHTGVISLDYRLEGTLAKCGSWYADKLGKTCRVMIPVDLRRHALVSNTASNLSLPIYLSINPGQSWQDIQAQLLSALSKNQELAREKLEQLALMIPRPLLRWVLSRAVSQAAKTGRFPISGILSDNGWIDLREVSTPFFHATRVISLPVYIPLAPFCLTVVHHADMTHIAVSVPVTMEIDGLKNNLLEILKSDQPPKMLPIAGAPGNVEDVNKLRALWAEVIECPPAAINTEVTFHNLGGDSIKLLFMLSEVTTEYQMESESAFFHAVLNTGGHISIQSLIGIIDQFRSKNVQK